LDRQGFRTDFSEKPIIVAYISHSVSLLSAEERSPHPENFS
jgi:hypothetical protein